MERGKISVCIIAKNEEKNIGCCLAALSQYDFEIVVTDTGSSDATAEIARKYTDKVYDYEWHDDFAAAKNYAISRASNDMVMVVDSDEFIEEFDETELLNLIAKNEKRVGRIRRINIMTRDGERHENKEWLNRIFDRRYYHYEGRIHEQVVRRPDVEETDIYDGKRQPYESATVRPQSSTGPAGTGGDNDYETYYTPVVMKHTGYDLTLEERRNKAERNRRLLLAELEETGSDPYILYQLGKCAYMSADYEEACRYFSEGLSFDLNPKLEYVIDMVETYGYAMINAGRASEALSYEAIYDEFGDSADFKFLMGLIYMNNERYEDAIAQFMAATKYGDCRNTGVNSYAAYYNIGVINECLGRCDEATRYYRKCGSYPPAISRLNVLQCEATSYNPDK